MTWKFLPIGLLLTICTANLRAQILNQTGLQSGANFNIGGTGASFRFITAPDIANSGVDQPLWTLSRRTSATETPWRWNLGYTGLETGSDVGSDFAIWSYNDAGQILRRNLTIRRSNGFVGIGTATPGTSLHVQGGSVQVFSGVDSQVGVSIGVTGNNRWALIRRAANEGTIGNGFSIYEDNTGISSGTSGARLHIAPGGRVGIGTTTPESILHIAAPGQTIKFGFGTNTSGYAFGIGLNDEGVNINNDSGIRGFNFNNANGRLITIASNGNVGIGTNNPNGHKLCVAGSGIFTKVVVKQVANWPDFVFEEDYQLRPIEDVMAYIKEHKHLPVFHQRRK